MKRAIIALIMLAVPGVGLAQIDANEDLPTREVEIHNHTDLTISRLSLRRLSVGPGEPVDETTSGKLVLESAEGWEDVLDETGAQQVLETHTHLGVSWGAEECWAEFRAEMSDGTAEHGSVDACSDTQLQFGEHFDHD